MSIDLKRARQFLEQKEKTRHECLQKRLKQAQDDVRRIIDHMILNYSPKRIYQWGSLINTHQFNELSDIDIAIEGIYSAKKFFRLLKETEEMTDFPLDLVQLENIVPEYANLIRQKGIIVYEC